MELPMLIQRCLTYGVKIYPYQLKTILKQYEFKKVPDEKMAIFNALQTEKYVKALYYVVKKCQETGLKDTNY